jgi:hypothetical protein
LDQNQWPDGSVGLVRQGNKTLNVGADGQERVVRVLSAQKAEKLVRKLREKSKFQDFEGKLAQKGKRVGKVRVMLDETNKIAIVGIAAEGDDEEDRASGADQGEGQQR